MLARCFAFSFFLVAKPARAQIPAVHGALQHAVGPQVVEGTAPLVQLWVADRDAVFSVECTVNGRQQGWTSPLVPAGEVASFELRVIPPTVQAECLLVARFGNGLSERKAASLSWTWVAPPPEPELGPEPAGASSPPPVPATPSPPVPAGG